MVTPPPMRTPDAVEIRSGLPTAGPRVLAVLLPIAIVATLAFARGGLLLERPTGLTGGAENVTPAELTAAAAAVLDGATAKGARGYRFEIVQTSAIVARAGSPGIEVGDPADPTKVILVERHELATYLERGFVTDAGFSSEIRRGADDLTTGDGWDAAPMELAALVVDGLTYRNDGAGWYQTSQPPGIGLDPGSAALLPGMLRKLKAPADAVTTPPSGPPGSGLGDRLADLLPARTLAGTAAVADLPGIIAVDLAEATELSEPVTLAFDATGRLIGLRAVARNVNFAAHDLVIETVITFSYPASAPALPRPEPAYVAPAVVPDADGQ